MFAAGLPSIPPFLDAESHGWRGLHPAEKAEKRKHIGSPVVWQGNECNPVAVALGVIPSPCGKLCEFAVGTRG